MSDKLIRASDAVDIVAKHSALYCDGEVSTDKGEQILYEIMSEIINMPSAQPEYEPVTLEDFARTMSGITVWGFAAWQGWVLALIKEQGFVICREK